MNSEMILRAAASHLDWRGGRLIPEAYTISASSNYYLADLMWVTGSGYATEIEIKTSISDWRADNYKSKWCGLPPYISRFIYCVPENLGMPDFVPEFAGIWHVKKRGERNIVGVVRAPKRIGKEKVPDKVMHQWMSNLYYRYWQNKLHRDNRLPGKKVA